VTETRLYLEALERSLVRPRKYVQGAAGLGSDVDLWFGDPRLLSPPADANGRGAEERDRGVDRSEYENN
jgi:hypothetical protein